MSAELFPAEVEVAIFGAGIAGSSLAWQLAVHGMPRVALIDTEDHPGRHATGRSAAVFAPSYGPPAVRALTRASRAFLQQPPAGFSEQPLLQARGALFVAAPGQEDALRALYDELFPSSPRLQWLTAAEALQRVSVLRPQAVSAALYDPDALDMDVHALLQGFLRGARHSGATLHLGTQLEAAQFDGARWALRFRGGRRLRSRTVVNAAGAWADVLATQFGVAPIGLVPKRRSAFTFRAPEGVSSAHWPLVIGVDESWYFKPDAGQLLGSPANADPTEPQDVQPEAIDIALGIHAIESVSTLSIRRPTATWAGLRSFVSDGEPVIGFDPQCPGLFWHAAFGGYGIQSAVGASALAASLLRGGGVPEVLQREGLALRSVLPDRLRQAAGHADHAR
jgi:D-arginine dehydrogenase